MRILWFEVTRPQRYCKDGRVIGGWQDALEEMLVGEKDLELIVAFEGTASDTETRVVDGITYVPIKVDYSLWDRFSLKWSWEPNIRQIVPQMVSLVEQYQPDVIHVFGTEWPFGLIAEHTKVPVVIHIQGAIVPYHNAAFPPGYSFSTKDRVIPWWNIKLKIGSRLRTYCLDASRERMERRIWKTVENYMGRTEWDRVLSSLMHPGRSYYHVEEALRPSFLRPDALAWRPPSNARIRLITVGCSSFYKGPDMLLKTAHVLMEAGVDFEWLVAGQMPSLLKKTVESREQITFEGNNVKFIGFTAPDLLADLLCNATLYVHTAYIENSPNSICEAQILGVPIVSTNVGGISSLVIDGEDGVLVPANDPWQMAGAIMELSRDSKRMIQYSKNSRQRAMARHARENVLHQLFACYQNVCKQSANIQKQD